MLIDMWSFDQRLRRRWKCEECEVAISENVIWNTTNRRNETTAAYASTVQGLMYTMKRCGEVMTKKMVIEKGNENTHSSFW